MPNEQPQFSTLGIIAGGGDFPILCAKAAQKKGIKVVAIAHKGETSKELENYTDYIKWIYLGQLNKLIKTLKKHKVTHTIFAGTIKKKRIFFDVRPDTRALLLWKSLKNRLDDNILRALADELEKESIKVIPSTIFLDELLTKEGVLTKLSPTKEQLEDIRFGWKIAKEIGRLDIGQCIVVKDKTVIAVEAIEGTDATIKRVGELNIADTIVIKICKPSQDTRFDLPATGPQTIKNMAKVRAKILALEANKSLMFSKEEMIKLANNYGIGIIGIGKGGI